MMSRKGVMWKPQLMSGEFLRLIYYGMLLDDCETKQNISQTLHGHPHPNHLEKHSNIPEEFFKFLSEECCTTEKLLHLVISFGVYWEINEHFVFLIQT